MAKSFESANTNEVLDALLNSDQTLNSLGIGTAAIVQGFIGKVEAIRFDEVSGTGIKARTDNQTIRIQGVAAEVKLAEKGENPVSFFLIFEGGARKIAIPALFQNPKSSITDFNGVETECMKMTGKQWKALIGATIECTLANADDTIMIPKPSRRASAEVGETEMKPSRVYQFKVTAEA